MELLAHISARTSNKDDDKYRAQALGYSAFESRKRTRLDEPSPPIPAMTAAQNAAVQTKSSSNQSGGSDVRDFAVFVDNTQEAISALESQILTSSLRKAFEDASTSAESSLNPDLIATPGQPPPAAPGPGDRSETNSTEASTQIGPPTTSRPVDPVHHNEPPNRDDEREAGLTDSRRRSITAVSSPQPGDPHISPAKANGSSSWSDDGLNPELPSTYSISDETSKGSSNRIDGQPSSIESPTARFARDRANVEHKAEVAQVGLLPTSSDAATFGVSRASVPSLPSQILQPPAEDTEQTAFESEELQRQEEVDVVTGRDTQSELPHISPAVPEAMEGKTGPLARIVVVDANDLKRKAVTEVAAALNTSSLEASSHSTPPILPIPSMIPPPPPPTSIDPIPASFLTPSLISLATNPQLKDRYKPKTITRALGPKERGHWSFDPSCSAHWTIATEREMWDFLRRLVEGGNLGWGVWCARETGNGSQDGSDDERLGRIRIYCWGEIVEHVYLLLYVASKSKVRKDGATWCDAKGQVVIKM